MNWVYIFTTIVSLLSMIGSLFVLRKGFKRDEYKRLVFLSLVMGPLWAGSVLLFFFSQDVIAQRIIVNIIYTISIAGTILTSFFVQSLPTVKSNKVYRKLLLYFPAIFFLFEVWFTDNFVLSITDKTPQFGCIYILWIIWLFVSVLPEVISLVRSIKDTSISEIEKKQVKYIIGALVISSLGMVPANMVLPYFGVYEYIWIGPLAGSLMVVILSYAVSTIRFYNLKTVLKSISSFFVSNILPSLIMGAISMLLIDVNVSIGYWLLLSFISFISFLFINLFRTKLFKKEDPSSTLSEKMSTVLELDDIGREIIDLMSEVLNAKQTEMYVIDENKRSIYRSSN